jgi:hypothetical protein
MTPGGGAAVATKGPEHWATRGFYRTQQLAMTRSKGDGLSSLQVPGPWRDLEFRYGGRHWGQ